MNLREWAKRCSVGDTCTIHGARIQCRQVQPDKWISGCSDCAFVMCNCVGAECEAYYNEQRGAVFFSVVSGSLSGVDLDAEIESYTLHPPRTKTQTLRDWARSAKPGDSCCLAGVRISCEPAITEQTPDPMCPQCVFFGMLGCADRVGCSMYNRPDNTEVFFKAESNKTIYDLEVQQ